MSESKNTSLAVLAFAPHPDDAELFCGGMLALHAERGFRSAVVDLTAGELSSQGTLETRAEESAAASSILGLSYRSNLGLPDGGINSQDTTQTNAVVRTIRELKPEILLAPYQLARHPDHVETSKLITRAAFLSTVKKYQPELGSKHQVSQLLYYQMRYEFTPSFITDISSVYQKKMDAIKCYSSQINRSGNGPGTLLSSPLSLSSLVARDQHHGSMIGVEYGEAFFTDNVIGISNPLEHFRQHPGSTSLAFPGKA